MLGLAKKIFTLSRICSAMALFCSLFFNVSAIEVPATDTAPIIDGVNNEPQWQKSQWLAIDQVIIGGPLNKYDFQGRYRLLWGANKLYLQAEIVDDRLVDFNADPLDKYWDDDTLEIFLDEDASGGDHQYSYNAFAYHIALDNQVVDITPQRTFALFNDHIESRWKRDINAPHKIIWEMAISLYADDFDPAEKNSPVGLHKGKKIGFMLAYCDNDNSETREHFINSKDVTAVNGDKNRGWIDASVFDTLILGE
ncbi:sugar-binding protein [Aliiglaciecola sp. 3_MG-2023]|uniref:sugar-binding protein n=1 Tax=Aliiglaciecola sp. 3_MG-2023 TaxID=3062644 RepID=UPI0026E29E11|nr:sugar-binding protein [Aliiglaciecola sp. 3_MG-2023]MDO6695335.1 sugar-binding protein [Aliiglaciecola sp. 3_MG-2023]